MSILGAVLYTNMKIKIKVVPKSSRSQIIGFLGDQLKVKLKAAPVDGAANLELIKLLSKELKIPQKNIYIAVGKTSKNKIVQLDISETSEQKIKEIIAT